MEISVEQANAETKSLIRKILADHTTTEEMQSLLLSMIQTLAEDIPHDKFTTLSGSCVITLMGAIVGLIEAVASSDMSAVSIIKDKVLKEMEEVLHE